MKKILIFLLLFVNIVFAKSEFIQMCNNPTPSQKVTLEAIVIEDNFTFGTKKLDEVSCETLEKYLKHTDRLFFMPRNLNDLTPLQYFKNLESLTISKNDVVDLSPLKNLTNMKKLDISYNPIRDVSVLQNFQKLKSLTLVLDKVEDIFAIENLTKLEFINFIDIQIIDFQYFNCNPPQYMDQDQASDFIIELCLFKNCIGLKLSKASCGR